MIRKITFVVILILGVVLSAQAKSEVINPDRIAVSDVRVEKVGEQIEVSFNLSTARVSRRGYSVIYAPVITDGINKVSLTPVAIRNNRAAHSWERHNWAADTNPEPKGLLEMRNNDRMSYRAVADFQPWMYQADVVAELYAIGCCSTLNYGNAPIASSIIGEEPEPEPVPAIVLVPVAAPLTTAERLAQDYPYLVPAEGWSRDTWGDRFDGDRQYSVDVYFRVAKSNIDRSYKNNGHKLDEIAAVINEICNSTDSRVVGIVVAGFASPEGNFGQNDKLSWNRASAVKEYLVKNTPVKESDIIIQNGSVDWYGLRSIVVEDSNMPDRDKVLNIIDENPITDSRTNAARQNLLRNSGAKTYKYLLENIYPELRRGSCVRIYFEEK